MRTDDPLDASEGNNVPMEPMYTCSYVDFAHYLKITRSTKFIFSAVSLNPLINLEQRNWSHSVVFDLISRLRKTVVLGARQVIGMYSLRTSEDKAK